MSFLVFFLSFFLIVNRYWVKSFFEGLVRAKVRSKDIKDPKILKFIKSKTGLSLKKIKLLDTDTTWGMMAGLPGIPYMVIARDAYENLSNDELQWLYLHEAGHYKLWHNLKMIFLQLGFLVSGYFILQTNFYPLLLAALLGVIFAIIYTQIVRNFEYEANYFALKRMDNPKGLKNLYKKVEKRWYKNKIPKDTLWDWLFKIWLLEIYKDLAIKAKS